MTEASGLGAVVRWSDVHLEEKVTADGVGPDELLPLYDPQTSGGLLVAVPERRAQAFVRALEAFNTLAAIVGEVVEAQMIRVIP
jgi:selenide,water dikinase